MTKPQKYILISLQSENQAIKLGENININYYFFSRTKKYKWQYLRIFLNNIFAQLLKVKICVIEK